jgi:ABC-type sugar transport system substrate-binding protein
MDSSFSHEKEVDEPGPGERRGVTRLSFLRAGAAGAGTLAAGGLLAACGSGSSKTATAAAAPQAGSAIAGQKRKVIWAIPAIAEWNQAVDVGFHDAATILGWDYQKVGVPIAEYSPTAVVNTINQAIQAKPDLLVTPGYVPGAYPAMANAQKQGILVMINDADNSPKQSAELGIAHVGSDEETGAFALGQTLAKAAQAAGHSSGVFLVSVPFAGNANLEAHVNGMKRGVGSAYRVEEFNGKEGAGSAADSLSAYKAKMTQVGSSLVGIVTAGGDTGVLAVKEQGKKPGEILVGTFDEDEKVVQNIQAGWVTAAVSSQRYAWGYMPTMLAWQYFERGVEPRSYLTGRQIVDKATVDAFSKQINEISALAKKYNVRLS